MNLRIGRPQYGGAFETIAATDVLAEQPPAPPPAMRFVLPGEVVSLPPAPAGGSSPEDPSPFTIVTPSASRVEPVCRHFGVCGGCDYQHAAYPTQLDIKQQVLSDILQAAELRHLPGTLVHPSDPYHYRNRVRLRVETADGAVRVGYNRRATRVFLPIVECPIAAPSLWQAAEAFTELANGPAHAAFLRSVAEVEFQTSVTKASLSMTLFTRDRGTAGFESFCDALSKLLPELTGAGCLPLAAGYGGRERASWGNPGIAHDVRGHTFWVSRGAFFQSNRFLLPTLLDLVTRERGGGLAWDLYAGVGLFSRVLASTFDQVVAVESSSISAADLAQAARKLKNLQAESAETADFLRRALVQRDRPDLIVVDPPRAGLGSEVCRLLARAHAPEIVSVSCDPSTLARDLRMLVDSGYRIEAVHLLDMFPQTFHIETVVFLRQ